MDASDFLVRSDVNMPMMVRHIRSLEMDIIHLGVCFDDLAHEARAIKTRHLTEKKLKHRRSGMLPNVALAKRVGANVLGGVLMKSARLDEFLEEARKVSLNDVSHWTRDWQVFDGRGVDGHRLKHLGLGALVGYLDHQLHTLTVERNDTGNTPNGVKIDIIPVVACHNHVESLPQILFSGIQKRDHLSTGHGIGWHGVEGKAPATI